MKTYEYRKYMRDGSVRTITAVVRDRRNGKRKKEAVEGKEAARV